MRVPQSLETEHGPRIDVLNGWRAISILLVIASHMLPLGPKSWALNQGSGELGMAVFFCLSGFLVTTQLQRNHNLLSFYIRRLFRILPLAVPVILGAAIAFDQSLQNMALNLLFLENYVFWALMPGLAHFWSLCVEMHFYLFIGLAMWVTRFRAPGIVLWVWLGLTIYRGFQAPSGTIETHFRVDEILAGANLALLQLGHGPAWARTMIARVPWFVWALVLGITGTKFLEPLHVVRGFAAAGLVGNTLLCTQSVIIPFLRSRPMRYLAEISYAVYVIHPLAMVGWLGQGATPLIKYAKRPLCFAVIWAAAHLSTFYYEHRFILWGKLLAARVEERVPREVVARVA